VRIDRRSTGCPFIGPMHHAIHSCDAMCFTRAMPCASLERCHVLQNHVLQCLHFGPFSGRIWYLYPGFRCSDVSNLVPVESRMQAFTSTVIAKRESRSLDRGRVHEITHFQSYMYVFNQSNAPSSKTPLSLPRVTFTLALARFPNSIWTGGYLLYSRWSNQLNQANKGS
jgi:hypothetical protein